MNDYSRPNADFSDGPTQERVIARFYMDAIPKGDSEMTEDEKKLGYPVFKDVEFVELRHPGDRSYNFIAEVSQEHKMRFPQQYAAFRAGESQVHEGTPIEQWPAVTKAEVFNLKGIGIRTIEDLATMPDSALPNLGHAARAYRDRALAWTQAAQKGAAGIQAAKEVEKLTSALEAKDAQIADLAARLDALEKGKRKTLSPVE